MSGDSCSPDKWKIINDPIHGSISVHPLCVMIIDTPEFQRLRYIKQLGSSYLVYPGAVHTRFEHCIGVYHLARELTLQLQQRNEKDKDATDKTNKPRITDKDVLCVSIAGLCHDLGHGPFSHLWERFMKLKNEGTNRVWKHEEMSLRIFRRIWEKLVQAEKIPGFDLVPEDVDHICKLMIGLKDDNSEKEFLSEIVANRQNGVDVDRWDYVLRDTYYLGFSNSFDYRRLIRFIRVLRDEGKYYMCFRWTELGSLTQMFQMRWCLHHRAYQHRVVRIIEKMIVDAFNEADEDLLPIGSDGKRKKLSECVDDIESFLKMDDFLYHRIKMELPESHPARIIVDKLENRNLYKCVAEVLFTKDVEFPLQELDEKIKQETSLDSFTIEEIKIDYGLGRKDPIPQIKFYERNCTTPHPVQSDLSKLLPQQFQEGKYYCICTDENTENQEKIKKAFDENWKKIVEKL